LEPTREGKDQEFGSEEEYKEKWKGLWTKLMKADLKV
jgi:hypothetical protein